MATPREAFRGLSCPFPVLALQTAKAGWLQVSLPSGRWGWLRETSRHSPLLHAHSGHAEEGEGSAFNSCLWVTGRQWASLGNRVLMGAPVWQGFP